jgi:hypothetical protein
MEGTRPVERLALHRASQLLIDVRSHAQRGAGAQAADRNRNYTRENLLDHDETSSDHPELSASHLDVHRLDVNAQAQGGFTLDGSVGCGVQ